MIRDASGEVLRDRRGARCDRQSSAPSREINTGCISRRAAFLREALEQLSPKNAQGEYYLTDIIAIARARGMRNPRMARRRTRPSLPESIRERSWQRWKPDSRPDEPQADGGGRDVHRSRRPPTFRRPAEIGADSVIGPNVQILGASKIGCGVRIEGTAWLSNVTIGDRCHLKLGVRAEECHIGDDSEIGPFAHLRAGTELAGHNRIGNFVETKKARFGIGSKASHLSYLGDAVIGAGTNIGCGVITVNYDGYDKIVTEIGDHCMMGCDTQLVAPVKLGNDVYVASGTTIMREVPDGSLVLSHHPQREKPGWVAAWRKRHGDDGKAPTNHASKPASK